MDLKKFTPTSDTRETLGRGLVNRLKVVYDIGDHSSFHIRKFLIGLVRYKLPSAQELTDRKRLQKEEAELPIGERTPPPIPELWFNQKLMDIEIFKGGKETDLQRLLIALGNDPEEVECLAGIQEDQKALDAFCIDFKKDLDGLLTKGPVHFKIYEEPNRYHTWSEITMIGPADRRARRWMIPEERFKNFGEPWNEYNMNVLQVAGIKFNPFSLMVIGGEK